ncbi:Pickpocket protein 28 [Frankliniella fusca]|uniref:Pickpocket protein 28 n=1 Tax=Frankliniella fusca TaxID=407009 RepID=A0AAE1H1E1_9NEOP|nr:Pickpocket protein 28 [Frankliniella fusca]
MAWDIPPDAKDAPPPPSSGSASAAALASLTALSKASKLTGGGKNPMDGDLVAVFRSDLQQHQYGMRPRPRHPSSLAWSTSTPWAGASHKGELARGHGLGLGPGLGPGHTRGTRPEGGCSELHWVETAQQYCQSSSLHGLRYVGDTGISPVERCFWVVSFALAVIVAAYFITDIYQRWENSPVINSVAPVATPIFQIPFPAITICNMNRARRTIAEAIKIGSARNPYNALQRRLLSDICDDNDFNAATNTSVDEVDRTSGNWSVVMGFMINVSFVERFIILATARLVTQPCHEMLLTCKWRNQPMDCDNLFNAVLTDEGICCTFNRVRRDLTFRNPRELSDLNITFPYPSADWTPETGYPETDSKGSVLETPWRPVGIGTHLGLTVSLDSEINDYYCSSTFSAGFKASI